MSAYSIYRIREKKSGLYLLYLIGGSRPHLDEIGATYQTIRAVKTRLAWVRRKFDYDTRYGFGNCAYDFEIEFEVTETETRTIQVGS